MTDIKVGDLVKATRKSDPEETVTGTVQYVGSTDVVTKYRTIFRGTYDFEVLDRPLPPISDELLIDAINVWRKGYYGFGPERDVARDKDYREAAINLINFVREYDRKNNTEESK